MIQVTYFNYSEKPPDESKPKKSGAKGRKSEKLAAKVALMKMKMHAAGDSCIPQTERIHLQILLPSGGRTRNKPIFFSCVSILFLAIDTAQCRVMSG